MKTTFISLLLFTSTALACTNNPLFDICKQTASIASSQCEAANTKCLCSAQKQLLACYSECTDDASISGLLDEQKKKMQAVCDQPGAEAEVKMRKKNNDLDTMGAPIRITEPFKAKPKPQSVNNSDDGIIRASAQSPDQPLEPSVNEKEKPKDDSEALKNPNHIDGINKLPFKNDKEAKNVSVNSGGSFINPVAPLLPLAIFALTGFYF